MPKNKVVYTCVTNGYDSVCAHDYTNPDWDYVLFTDDAALLTTGKIHHWSTRPLPFTALDASRNSRYPKINAHVALAEYAYSFYVDGNVNIISSNIFHRLEQFIQTKKPLAIAEHPHRDCIYDEALIIKKKCIDFPEVVDAQMTFLQAEGFPTQFGLFENNLIFREHNHEKLVQAQELWWRILTEHSRRDQLSGVYAFWKYNLPIAPLYTRQEAKLKRQEVQIITKATHSRYIAQSRSIFPKWFIYGLAALCPMEKYKHKIIHKLESYRKPL